MITDSTPNMDVTDDYSIVETVMRLARTIKRTNHGYNHHHNNHEHGPHHHSDGRYNRSGLGDIRLLNVIAENNSASSRELAEIIDVRPSSLTEMLNRLEDLNYIRRFRDDLDSRIIHVELTDGGSAYMKDASENHLRLHNKIAGCLNRDEQEIFIEFCERLMKAAREGADN